MKIFYPDDNSLPLSRIFETRAYIYLCHAVLSIILFAGCSGSPLTRYPDFIGVKNNIVSMVLIGDVITLQAHSADTSIIDIPENSKYAKSAFDFLAGSLNEKGYKVERTLLTSLGLLMNRNRVCRIITSPEEREWGRDLLPAETPPYYIHQTFLQDTSAGELLNSVYFSLVGYKRGKNEPADRVPEAVRLGKIVGGGLLGVIFISGYNVPPGMRTGRNLTRENLSSVKIAVEANTQISVMFYLIDTENGEIIWDDRVVKNGGTIGESKIIDMLTSLIEELP